jgi:hypothetical protein
MGFEIAKALFDGHTAAVEAGLEGRRIDLVKEYAELCIQ